MSCYYGHTELEPNCMSCREETYKTRSKIELYVGELELYLDELEHQMNKVNVVLASLKHEIKYRNL